MSLQGTLNSPPPSGFRPGFRSNPAFGSPPDLETLRKTFLISLTVTGRREGASELSDSPKSGRIENQEDFWGPASDWDEGIHKTIEKLERAVELHPEDANLYFKLGFAYNRLRKWLDVVRTLNRAIELFDESEAPWRVGKLAASHYLQGYAWASIASQKAGEEIVLSLFAAESAFRKVIELAPEYGDAYYYLGTIYHNRQQFEDAEREFKRATEIDPNHAKAYSDLGVLYQELNRPQEAFEAFRKSVQADPKNVISLENLASSYLLRGDLRAAKEMYEQAIKADPGRASAHHGLGATALQMEEWEEAEQALRRAIELNPDNGAAHSDLGIAYYRLDRPEEAKRVTKQAIKLSSGNSTARHNLRLMNLDTLEATVTSRLEVMKRENIFDADRFVDEIAHACGEVFETGGSASPPTSCTPEELLSVLTPAAERMGPDERLEFAAKVFERNWLSSGKAARLAGTDRISFLMNLHRFGVAVLDLNEQEMDSEARYGRGE